MLPTTPRHPRTSRRPVGAALVATVALLPALLAGCSTAEGSGPSSSPAAGGSASASAQLGQCLRDAGYDVDDPDLGKGMVVAVPEGADPERYGEDFDTCRAQLPEAEGGGSQKASDAEVAQWQAAQLKVAECVREKGFEDFPDPVDGDFPDQQWSTSDPSPEQEALFACSAEVGPNAGGADE